MNEDDELFEEFLETFSIERAALAYYREHHHTYAGYDYSISEADDFARKAHNTLRLVRNRVAGDCDA